MVKILFLQSLYNLSDQQAEKVIHDRNSFMNFLDMRDSLMQGQYGCSGRGRGIWNEIQREIDSKGIKIKNGTIKNVTFITA